MLKKLRVKFVLINMTIVIIMLSAIFATMYVSTSKSLEKESLQMMESIASEPMMPGIPGMRRTDIMLPYIRIQVGRSGDIIEAGSSFYDLTDRTMLIDMLNKVSASGTESGVIEDYTMRFLIKDLPIGWCIVFADMTNELTTLSNLTGTFAVIGAAAFLLFLMISILLARWAVKPVETAWQQQKQFIADASHELKTPLTVIMTDADLLTGQECTDEDRSQLSASILTMSSQMRGLVDSMLSLARLDSGSLNTVKEQVSLSDTVYEASMMFEPVFYEKGLPFTYDIEPGITVKGDRSQLKQLTDILLDNAAKYAECGGDTVLKLKKISRTHCVLEVADKGEPISSEDMKKLFTRFYRADRARAMNHSYGLGLSIAESIVSEHHGRIWAESRDSYNIFTAELPTS